ncbi:2-dehydro-3-deoxygalactonokinase [Pricia antarctica]|uniref:2-dehydro-3-deoxygalactonokinase n=1 Tax=Pricia antarctica TaxID=641691 RepID=A0A1G7F888_9FLAO|nr:2-dehydro-3-deoxygalactonokinase [Pricia antarctica]SDE72163.1 2-dehydro-3-deoxygalactonokinase [Pricia antarctica]
MKNYLLCCDWGTSSFRLQLVNIVDQQVIGEVRTTDGISETFNAWKNEEGTSSSSRDRFFRQRLSEQIGLLSHTSSIGLDNVPIVISGMASSSIGLRELPYATLPFSVDGSEASIVHLDPQEDFPHHILLISGVQSDTDVMRGEETQLIGLAASAYLSKNQLKESILIFPGTHSKHIVLRDNRLIDFQTFMTGEIFGLMADYSILKQSVETIDLDRCSQKELDAFKSGVGKSRSANVLNSLFTVRTNRLFDKLNKEQNFLFLSGLLIGEELKHLRRKMGCQLILCSDSKLYELYRLALEELGLLKDTILISGELVDKAAIAGQIKIFQYESLKSKGQSL